MRGDDAKLCFNKKERGKVWEDYMEKIINEENYLDNNMEGDAVEGPVDYVGIEEVVLSFVCTMW